MNPLSIPEALALTQQVLGAGLLVQTGELLLARRIYEAGGALAGTNVVPGLVLRLLLAAILTFVTLPTGHPLGVLLHLALLASSVWLTIRSRGPVCGGSDSMFFQVQLGLTLAQLPFFGTSAGKVGLLWIAVQSVLSYFLAGLAKVRNPRWWNGRALQSLFASQGPYVLLAAVRPWANKPVLCATLGWATMAVEFALPAALVVPAEVRLLLLALAGAFHLFNAAVLGLNRFVWAWLATYPAFLAVGA